MNRRYSTMSLGIPSIIALIIVLAMLIVTLLSYKAAVNNEKTVNREIEFAYRYYRDYMTNNHQ